MIVFVLLIIIEIIFLKKCLDADSAQLCLKWFAMILNPSSRIWHLHPKSEQKIVKYKKKNVQIQCGSIEKA